MGCLQLGGYGIGLGRQTDWLLRGLEESCSMVLCLQAAHSLQAPVSPVVAHCPSREEPTSPCASTWDGVVEEWHEQESICQIWYPVSEVLRAPIYLSLETPPVCSCRKGGGEFKE